jgi:hypothetical protein
VEALAREHFRAAGRATGAERAIFRRFRSSAAGFATCSDSGLACRFGFGIAGGLGLRFAR